MLKYARMRIATTLIVLAVGRREVVLVYLTNGWTKFRQQDRASHYTQSQGKYLLTLFLTLVLTLT